MIGAIREAARARAARLLASGVLTLVGAFASPAGAQEAAAPAPPTVESIEARAKELQAREELAPALRDELLQRYQKALAELQQARTWSERKAEYDGLAAEAPGLVASIREELARPPGEVQQELAEDATLKQLEAASAQAEADLAQAQKLVEELKSEATRRGGRRSTIPAELQEARGRLAPLLAARRTPPPTGQDPLAAEAAAALLAAQIVNLEGEVAARESELASYEARSELLPARRDRAQRRLLEAQQRVDALRDRVNAARQKEADAAARAAREKRRELARRFPALNEVAERTEELALERSGELSAKLAAVEEELDERILVLERLRSRAQRVVDRLQASARSTALGAMLRGEYANLPRTEQVERRLRGLAEESAAIQYRLIELDEWRDEAGDPLLRVQRALAEARAAPQAEQRVSEAEVPAFEEVATRLFETEKETLSLLIDEYDQYFEEVLELIDVSRALVEETDAYRAQIEEHILWVRSVPGDRLTGFLAAGPALAWLLDPEGWTAALRRVLAHAGRHWAWTGALVSLLLLAFHAQRRCQADLRRVAPLVARYKSDTFALTLRALADTLVAALPVPLLLWIVGRLMEVPAESEPDVASAVGTGLERAGVVLYPLALLRKTLRSDGLAAAHFRWNAAAISTLRRNLRWATPVAVAAVALVVTLSSQLEPQYENSLGRLAFMAAMVPFAVFLQRLLRPGGDVLRPYLENNPEGLLARSSYVLLVVGVLTPIALSLLAGLGYFYSAQQLQRRLEDTLVLVLALVLLNALADRWLFLARRRLAVEQALKRRKEKPAPAGPTESGGDAELEEQVDIPAINAQTKKLFRVLSGSALVLCFFWIWAEVLPALRALENVRVWPHLELVDVRAQAAAERKLAELGGGAAEATAPAAPARAEVAKGTSGGVSLTSLLPPLDGGAPADPAAEGQNIVDLADVLLALVLLAFTWIAGQNLPALLEMGLLQRLPLDAGSRYAVKTVVRYALTIVGITAAFGAIGIGWAKVQWLAAALTFGLAFGLQEIFANFVSGLIILFERPIRLDDIVNVGGVEGKVARIRMRATTILDWDRRELLVPNKDFLTGHLINYTLTDPMSRYVLKVGVAYGSDTRLACDLLVKCARACEWVVDDPQPSSTFVHFGDSALLLELRVYMATRDHVLSLIDDLHRRVDEAFRAAGLEIAFPQLDLHLRSDHTRGPLQAASRVSPPPPASAPSAS